MPDSSAGLISKIRTSSREMVRELGFMNRTIAGTDLTASAVHAIVEVGAAGRLSAKHLSERLLLEKSTVSRLVRSLVERGELGELRSEEDARSKYLHLTNEGEKALAAITKFAESQVASAIAPLGRQSRLKVLQGLETYAGALTASRKPGGVTARDDPRACIGEGYTPALIGRIVEMHAAYYSRSAGFGAAFEAKVAGDLAGFITRLHEPTNQIWYGETQGRIAASIAVDGDDLGDGLAHLRWFIVDDGLRGMGMGKSLLQKALAFCAEHDFQEIHLWTLKGLEAARRLYEDTGFVLIDEYRGDQWGTEIVEQKFVRPRSVD